MFEIFVYSPRFEGVHLRGGKVARGGLRWSDRPEDFRTEVLGLVKAQMVKNTVIVPVGSKGGFVLKRAPPATDRDAFMKEGVACYQDYLRGLLDLTDNRVGDAIVPPPQRASGTTPTTRTSWSPPTRARRPSPITPTRSARNTASGWATRSPPAARSATTTRRWASPRAARGSRSSATSARWASTRRRPTSRWPASATCRATCSATACCCRSHIRLVAAFDHRHIFLDPEPRRGDELRRARAPVQAAALVVGRLRHEADLDGRRHLSAQREVDRDHARSEATALGIDGRCADADRADQRDPQGAGRSALQRRHRHLRQGSERDARGGRRPRQRRAARQRPRAALQGRRRRRQPRLHAARARRVRAGRRPHQHRRHRQLRRRGHLRPRGQHQDPARACRSPKAS